MTAPALATQGMTARLPLLGPLIGWRRTHPQDERRTLARLWIKADDSDSRPAVMALTARWDAAAGKVVKGSVRLWSIWSAGLPRVLPPAQERFALADLDFGPEEAGIVRMVTVHLTRDVAPRSGGARFIDPTEARRGAPRRRPRAGSILPQPEEIAFDAAFPQQDGVTPEKLAEDLFRELEAAIARARRPRPPGEVRPTPRERTACIEQCEARLRPDRGGSRLRFAAGCCRHPGMGFDRELADRSLGALSRRALADDGPELVLMLGDQIYSDATGGVIDAEDRLEKYTSRYCDAFETPGFRQLARSVPVYMAGDDHEIRDNWPRDAVPPGARAEAKTLLIHSQMWAQRLFLAHQRSHGPDQPDWAPAASGSRGLGFWYAFDAGSLPFFCFDTRFERSGDSTLMTQYQRDSFRAWLAEVCARPGGAARPKFILSGSVFAPAERALAGQPGYARRADNWLGYPEVRAEVIREIALREAQNVVFVSGDYHCGAVASLHFSGAATGLRCYAVVAPPFYAPFPFANLPAQEIAASESFATLDGAGRPLAVECRASGIDAAGFALFSVEPPAEGADPLDWVIRVEYHADEWDAGGRPGARLLRAARLAGGEAKLEPAPGG